ncbi:MAG: CpsD/CapB family tyrosine-protein kinase [Deltaproteobacteria bacterium]|nr:CpsD/CapB family tyrosine-protein kinase [Deltaproteobacteria bacterium]
MGKISDAFERRKREGPLRPEPLYGTSQGTQVIEDKEVIAAEDFCVTHMCSPKVVVLSSPHSVDAEMFRLLRAQILYARRPVRMRTIMITSALPGEGKSYVASNLAVSLALGMGKHVLAIDGDLRMANLHELLGVPNKKGVYEYLKGKGLLQDMISRTEIENLSILPAGNVPPDTAEHFTSERIEEFLKEVDSHFQGQYLLLDSPPVHITSETRMIAEHVDAIVFVVRAQKSPREEIKKCIESLGKDKILGVVFNGYSQVRKKYYRKYYEGSYKKKRIGTGGDLTTSALPDHHP